MSDTILSSPLLAAVVGVLGSVVGAVVGGLIAGCYSKLAVREGFSHERDLREEEELERQKGARRALIAEMAENHARLQLLAKQSASGSMIASVMNNLSLNRYALDAYMPLIAAGAGLAVVKLILETYGGPSNLLATLAGKWSAVATSPGRTSRGGAFNAVPVEDSKALEFAEQKFRSGLFETAKMLLSEDELIESGLTEPEEP
jgi:hypothetical protein